MAASVHTTLKQLPLFLAVRHQDLLGVTLTSTNRLIMKSFKHRHCLFYFLYQFFFFIKQKNNLWFFCLWHHQYSAIKIAWSVVHATLHEIFMVTSKTPLVFYHGFWGESHLFYSCLYNMLYFRINRRSHRWRWHCWDNWGHCTLVFRFITFYTLFEELHPRKNGETCFSPSFCIFLSLRILKARFGKQERVI